MIVALGRAEAGAEKSTDVMRLRFDTTFAGMDAAADKAASGMITQMARAEAGMTRSAEAMKGSVGGVFAGMDVGLVAATDVITHEFSRITASANRSSRAIGKMRGELQSLSTMSNLPLPQLPGMGAGGRGGSHTRPGQAGHGNDGLTMGGHSMNTPMGRVSGHGGTGAAIGGLVVLGDAVYEAATLEDLVTKVLITSQINPGEQPLTRNVEGAKVRALIQQGAILSGESQENVGSMVLSTEREFQGVTFDKKLDSMKILMPAIAAEAHLRHESLEQSAVSLIGVLHQAGLYSDEDMLKGAKEFQFSTMSTPVPLGQFKGALGYTMSELHGGLGMDTKTAMELTALAQSAGVTNTKSGTWTRQLFVESEPSTDVLGPLTKTQAQHNEALKMLGLVGTDGKQNWHVIGQDGKEDWTKSSQMMFQAIHDGLEKLPSEQRADVLHRAFGTQGSNAATLYSQQNIIDQLGIIDEKEKRFQGGDLSLAEYSQGSTIQQSRIAMQEFQVLMADLGTKLLPAVNAVLKEVSGDLRALPADWEATKKMWGDRFHFLAHPFGGSDPAPVPFKLPGAEEGLMQLNAYHTNPDGSPLDGTSSGGQSDATRALEDVVYRGTLHALLESAMGVSSGTGGGSFGGGGSSDVGAHNLRYGPGGHSHGGGGGGPLGLTPLAHGAVTGTLLARGDDAMAHLMSLGVTREAASAIVGNAQQESSVSGHGPAGDHGTAHGMFQWRFERFDALQAFARSKGKDWRDEHTELEFMVQEAKNRGNSGWLYGHDIYAANQGMKRFEQYGESPDGGNFRTRLGNAHMWNGRPPVTAFRPGGGTAAATPPIVIEHKTILDGKTIARSTSKHFAAALRHPTSSGGPDSHGSYIHPGIPGDGRSLKEQAMPFIDASAGGAVNVRHGSTPKSLRKWIVKGWQATPFRHEPCDPKRFLIKRCVNLKSAGRVYDDES